MLTLLLLRITLGDNDALYKLFQSRGYRNESTGGNNSAANPLPEKFNDTLKNNIVATTNKTHNHNFCYRKLQKDMI